MIFFCSGEKKYERSSVKKKELAVLVCTTIFECGMSSGDVQCIFLLDFAIRRF